MSKSYSLDFSYPVSDIDREPRTFHIEATPEECAALAERFELVGLDRLSADVKAWYGGRSEGIHLTGQLKAALSQRCIVSLGAVPETVDSGFELLLVSPEVAHQMDLDEAYLNPDLPDYDALEGDMVQIGEIVAQTLSILMDPYPRAPEVDIAEVAPPTVEVNAPELKRPNPFAVLDKLRDES